MESKQIFTRTMADSPGQAIGAGLYNLIIGAVLCWGFALNWWIVQTIPPEAILSYNIWLFLIAYFVSCITGIIMFTKSHSPLVSFVGYNLVVLPFGMVINVAIAQYEPTLVVDAMRVTGMVTAVMMVLGS